MATGPFPLDHLLLEPAGVTILTGEDDRPRSETAVHEPIHNWSLFNIRCGSAIIHLPDGDQRIPAPALILLTPDRPHTVSIPINANVQRLIFTVQHTARHRQPTSQAILGEPQPGPVAWLGLELPLLVEDPFRQRGMVAVDRGCRNWWRGTLRRVAAGAALQSWLYDWILALAQPRPAPDAKANDAFWFDLAHLARERLVQRVTVQQLADQIGLSRSGLFRRIQRERGISPKQWLDDIRFDEAIHLLDDEPDTPITNIARLCGFTDRAPFTRWFKKRCDLTPEAWRGRHTIT